MRSVDMINSDSASGEAAAEMFAWIVQVARYCCFVAPGVCDLVVSTPLEGFGALTHEADFASLALGAAALAGLRSCPSSEPYTGLACNQSGKSGCQPLPSLLAELAAHSLGPGSVGWAVVCGAW